MNTTPNSKPENRAIVSLNKFCQEAGISIVTAWRWRRDGWLHTVNICGRQYLTGEAIGAGLCGSSCLGYLIWALILMR